MLGISPVQLIIIFVIVLLLFGTKKLRNIGSDLGSSIKGFKKAMTDEEDKSTEEQAEKTAEKLAQKSESATDEAKIKDKDQA